MSESGLFIFRGEAPFQGMCFLLEDKQISDRRELSIYMRGMLLEKQAEERRIPSSNGLKSKVKIFTTDIVVVE